MFICGKIIQRQSKYFHFSEHLGKVYLYYWLAIGSVERSAYKLVCIGSTACIYVFQRDYERKNFQPYHLPYADFYSLVIGIGLGIMLLGASAVGFIWIYDASVCSIYTKSCQ